MLIAWLVVGLVVGVVVLNVLTARARSTARDPRSLVVTTTVEGAPATVVRARAGLRAGAVYIAYVAVFFLVVAAAVGGVGAVVVFGLLSTWLGLAAWFMWSGRMGDRTVVVTAEGLTQRWAGVEQSVRWDDVTGVAAAREGMDLAADPVSVRRLVPVLWTGRTRRPPGGVRIQLGDLHPGMQLTRSLLTWLDEPWRRGEIGTPEATDRLVPGAAAGDGSASPS